MRLLGLILDTGYYSPPFPIFLRGNYSAGIRFLPQNAPPSDGNAAPPANAAAPMLRGNPKSNHLFYPNLGNVANNIRLYSVKPANIKKTYLSRFVVDRGLKVEY